MQHPASRITGRSSVGKKAVLVAILLAVILLGLFLGAFINYQYHKKSYSATFVANEFVDVYTAA